MIIGKIYQNKSHQPDRFRNLSLVRATLLGVLIVVGLAPVGGALAALGANGNQD